MILQRPVRYLLSLLRRRDPFALVILIGDNITIGPNTAMRSGRIVSSPRGSIVIGDWCSIGRNVAILGVTHDPESPTGPHRRIREGPVRIGDNVWIGDNVLIAPNVSIGDNAVIGANVVVRDDVPQGSYLRNITVIRHGR